MTYTLIIDGKLPGLNEYTRACRSNPYKGAQLKGRSQAIVVAAIMAQRKFRHLQITCPVKIHYRWYEPNMRRDLDNISSFGRKVIQDALVKTQVLANDGWKNVRGFTDSFYVDKHRPRIEVEIMEV